ncbi:MAG: hypothetical protein A2902_02730 [Elusimicrobia bacterium RIFCSPLOWO2_01_FULL_64_13]|nr:MAG: hypothetical protein A2636_06705 [Elusimicrobia bacterium RIFCSPHIGHO2_01_FULL_64_10]OGR97567.1 MAG: hypothetical protein A2902_02730 [Elusimicrobia bacterium RIFCSPLOWO2_01_FULL_64_13]
MPLPRRLFREFAGVIRRNRTFFLSGHRNPDADTVGSELALASLLKRLGKRVDIYNAEPPPRNLGFLAGIGRIRAARKVSRAYDAAVIFECFDAGRMGNIIDLETQAGTVVNVDHHRHHSNFGDLNLIDPLASSNSEQLIGLFREMRLDILPNEAAALYAGIMTDTGRFRHSNTNDRTLSAAAQLAARGADPNLIWEKIDGTRRLPALRLLGRVLSVLEISSKGRIAFAALSRRDFKRCGADDEDTEEIVNYGLEVPTVLVSILVREAAPGVVKASLRSRRGVDVCRLAQKFGGGGHKYASGCKLETSLDRAGRLLLAAARGIL